MDPLIDPTVFWDVSLHGANYERVRIHEARIARRDMLVARNDSGDTVAIFSADSIRHMTRSDVVRVQELNVPSSVTINGRAHQLTLGSELTYERILELAGVRDDAWEGGPAPLGLTVTVKGRNGIGRTLTRGERVRVDPGLVVSAIDTGDA